MKKTKKTFNFIQNATILDTVERAFLLKDEKLKNFDAIFASIYNTMFKTNLCKLMGFT